MAAIAAAPDDDAPRRAYAAWLTRQGDPRGEFIAAQCELEPLQTRAHDLLPVGVHPEDGPPFGGDSLPELTPDELELRAVLDARCWELLTAHGERWKRDFSWAERVGFGRGFIDRVAVYPSYLRADLSGDDPELALVRRLEVIDAGTGSTPDEPLPAWTSRLLSLSVGNRALPPQGFAALARSTTLGALRELHVVDFPRLSDPPAAGELAAAPWLASLRVLSLAMDGRDARLGDVLDGPPYRALKRLSLRYCAVTPDVAARMARANGLRSVRHLDLGSTGLTSDALAQALARDAFPALVSLSLGHHGLGAGVVDPLVRAVASNSTLRVLGLRECALGPDALARLLAWPGLARCTHLDLSQNALGTDGVRALARSPAVSNLRVLKLGANHIDAAALAALRESPHLARLERLSVADNPLGHAAVAELLGSTSFPELRFLDVRNTGVPDSALAALVSAIRLPCLRVLRVADHYGGDAAALLTARPPWLSLFDEWNDPYPSNPMY
jgi:uncharacterized protein (TIGR02996 family)